MYAWRAEIGLINPGTGASMERDFHRFVPEGVGVITTRVPFGGMPSPEGLMEMADLLEDCAKVFSTRHHDLVMFGCTSGSLIGGPGFDQECIRRIERASGAPGLTTSTVLMEGFARLGVNRVAAITPYPDDTNAIEKHFLESHGIGVTSIQGMHQSEKSIADIQPSFVYQKVKEMDISHSDCIFISYTGLNVLDIIETIETDFGLPVITSNQVTLWGALRHARVGVKIPKLGKLFTL